MRPDAAVPAQANYAQDPGDKTGHYESFYLRANHPERPQAFWIRYTLFRPAGEPGRAIGELWAVHFDGESGVHTVAKEEFPLAECEFSPSAFAVRVGAATLERGKAIGSAGAITWDLGYSGHSARLYLLPRSLYRGRFPKAKSLVGVPLANFHGTLTVGGDTVSIADWVGSENHNWGSRHTDRYAFGQVAGFDDAPASFLEVVTAQTKLGPLWTPQLTLLVLRHNGSEHALTSLRQSFRAKAHYGSHDWRFASEDDDVSIAGRISAAPEAFVDLTYYNPPGGTKLCRNTKIAACELSVTDRATGRSETLHARHRALFEILG